MKTKSRVLSHIALALIILVMLIYAVIVVFPMAWTIIASFKTTAELYHDVWSLPGSVFSGFENYAHAWTMAEIGRNMLNSVVSVSISLVVNVFICSLTAYAIKRYRFRGSRVLGRIFIMGQFVPLVLGTIPTFFILLRLHLYDTMTGLILVYITYSIPFSVFIMMGAFETIPSVFAEAAVIDGCGHFRTYWSVMLPLAKSGIVTISIFHFLWTWNDCIYAMTYITSSAKRTLSVGLVKLTSMATFKTDWGALFAGLVIVMLPSLLIYCLFQGQLQKGLTAGGIKG